jgi:16S rRNA (uracil1498-N3)-methyltransferase
MRPGDELLATNLVGTCYQARVGRVDGADLICAIDNVLHGYGESKRHVTLIQAIISQPSRWEFLIEKATELGVKVIQPVITERTERPHFKADRTERILRAAVKQTKRANKPWLRMATTDASQKGMSDEVSTLRAALAEAVQEKCSLILLHELASPNSNLRNMADQLGDSPIAIAIGPEGGFSEEEVRMAREEFGAAIASLGPRRLRAETAAIAAVALVIR